MPCPTACGITHGCHHPEESLTKWYCFDGAWANAPKGKPGSSGLATTSIEPHVPQHHHSIPPLSLPAALQVYVQPPSLSTCSHLHEQACCSYLWQPAWIWQDLYTVLGIATRVQCRHTEIPRGTLWSTDPYMYSVTSIRADLPFQAEPFTVAFFHFVLYRPAHIVAILYYTLLLRQSS